MHPALSGLKSSVTGLRPRGPSGEMNFAAANAVTNIM
jgi:hypothetical protein